MSLSDEEKRRIEEEEQFRAEVRLRAEAAAKEKLRLEAEAKAEGERALAEARRQAEAQENERLRAEAAIKEKKNRKRGCLGCLGIVVAGIILLHIVGDSESTREPQKPTSPPPEPRTTLPPSGQSQPPKRVSASPCGGRWAGRTATSVQEQDAACKKIRLGLVVARMEGISAVRLRYSAVEITITPERWSAHQAENCAFLATLSEHVLRASGNVTVPIDIRIEGQAPRKAMTAVSKGEMYWLLP